MGNDEVKVIFSKLDKVADTQIEHGKNIVRLETIVIGHIKDEMGELKEFSINMKGVLEKLDKDYVRKDVTNMAVMVSRIFMGLFVTIFFLVSGYVFTELQSNKIETQSLKITKAEMINKLENIQKTVDNLERVP